jgi:hypothetical protein
MARPNRSTHVVQALSAPLVRSLSFGTQRWWKRSVQDWRSLKRSGSRGVMADDETLSETAIQGATAVYSRPKRQNGAKA